MTRKYPSVRLLALASASWTVSTVAAAQVAPSAPPPTATATATSTAPNPAQPAADQNNGGLQDIIVTAQKRSENLQKVPIAITAIDGAQLVAQGVRTTADLGKVAPGLNIRTTNSAFQPTIRGIGTSATFAENPTSLYIDGVYIPQQVGALRELNDVTQVAVLKGPQGTLFGRNSTAGVIQITTRAPSHQFHFEVGTEIDNYETSRSNAYVTGGLTSTLAASLSLQYGTQGMGWGRNLTTGAAAGYLDHSFAVRGKLLFEPSSRTTITLIGEHFNQLNVGNSLQPYPGTTFTYPGFGPTRSRYDTYANPENSLRVEGSSGSINIEQDIGFAKLVSISSIRHVDGANVFDVDGVAAPLFLITIPDQPSTDYTQEVQLASNHSSRFTWLLGAFYIHNFVSTNSLNFYLAPPLSPAPFPVQLVDTGRETTKSISGFGQATWEFVTDTRLTLGARYTHEDRTFKGTQSLIAAVFPGPLVTPIGSSVSADKPTFRASLDHQFTPRILGYASFNTGFKSGGYNLFSPTSPAYQPETVKAYEAGFKSEFLDRRVRLNASGFYYDYSNIQVTQVINNTQVISNGAKAKIYGLDVDAQVSLAQGLQVSGSLEALHAQFTRFDNAQIATPNPAGGAIITPGSASGKRLPLSQKFAGTAALDYDTELAGAGLHFNFTGSYQGDYSFEPDNFIRQPSYVDLSTSLKLTLPGERLSVMVWGKNLLDNAVISFGSATTAGFTTQYYAPPRTFGVTVRYKL